MERLGLVQVRDESQLGDWVDQVLAAHAESVAEWRAGNVKVFGFLIGQVMKRSAGRADPKRVRELLTARLDETAPTQ